MGISEQNSGKKIEEQDKMQKEENNYKGYCPEFNIIFFYDTI